MIRGEIWHTDLSKASGSEQGGNRPCLIIQTNIGNEHSATTIVCPITKKVKNFNATHVFIDCLREPSYVLCEQIRVIDKSKLKRKISQLDDEKMREVGEKIRQQLDI